MSGKRDVDSILTEWGTEEPFDGTLNEAHVPDTSKPPAANEGMDLTTHAWYEKLGNRLANRSHSDLPAFADKGKIEVTRNQEGMKLSWKRQNKPSEKVSIQISQGDNMGHIVTLSAPSLGKPLEKTFSADDSKTKIEREIPKWVDKLLANAF